MSSSSPAPGTILIADDNRVNRLLLARGLEQEGHTVVFAEHGREALDLLRKQRFDLLLLDVLMPELDGYEVLAELKDDPHLREIPVVVTSALDELDSVVRCVEMGAADYLPRPIKPTLLRARVATSLAEKRLRDDNARLLATVERQRQELSRFLSPQVAALVSTPEGEQLLAGHRRAVTSVFCDLRGYTAFAEVAEPEELLDVVREYHATVGRRAIEFDGTLEHYAGDGIHIFFNDPVLSRTTSCGRAHGRGAAGRRRGPGGGLGQARLRPGVRGRDRRRVRDRRADRRGGRYDYAAIGNAVILAARLSGKAATGQILVSQRCYGVVEDAIDAVAVDGLQLKGLSHPVTAWNVTGLREAG